MSPPNQTNCQIELFLVTLGEDGHLRFVRKVKPLCGDPDAVARELLAETPAVWLHSTSWRYENGGIVLTYLAWCERTEWDDESNSLLRLEQLSLAYQSRPRHPKPEGVTAFHVVAHGLRHFSWLAQRPSENPCLSILDKRTLAWLRGLDPLPSGQI